MAAFDALGCRLNPSRDGAEWNLMGATNITENRETNF